MGSILKCRTDPPSSPEIQTRLKAESQESSFCLTSLPRFFLRRSLFRPRVAFCFRESRHSRLTTFTSIEARSRIDFGVSTHFRFVRVPENFAQSFRESIRVLRNIRGAKKKRGHASTKFSDVRIQSSPCIYTYKKEKQGKILKRTINGREPWTSLKWQSTRELIDSNTFHTQFLPKRYYSQL